MLGWDGPVLSFVRARAPKWKLDVDVDSETPEPERERSILMDEAQKVYMSFTGLGSSPEGCLITRRSRAGRWRCGGLSEASDKDLDDSSAAEEPSECHGLAQGQ